MKIIGYYRKCDLLTMTGICFAFTGMLLAIHSRFLYAVLCILLCGLCDAFDGKLARKYEYEANAKVYGVQLDSLADAICSGAFPAVLTAVKSPHIASYAACAFFLLCGVIRLAYFNTMAADENAEKNVFIGVPITMSTVVYPLAYVVTYLIDNTMIPIVMPCVLFILGICFIIRVRIPKPDIGKILGKIFNRYTLNFLIFPLFILIISDIYFKMNFDADPIVEAVKTFKGHFLPFLMMLVVISAAFAALVSILGSSKKAKIVSAIVMVALLTINDVKYIIMGIPLQLSDVNYLNPDNITMIGTATSTIGSWIIKVIIKSTAAALLCVVFILIDRGDHTFKFKSAKHRILSLILSLVLLVTPSVLGSSGSLIPLDIYGLTQVECRALPSIDVLYSKYGFYQGLYLNGISSNYLKRSDYNRDEISSIVANAAASNATGNWGKANVVFLLSECFTDIENMAEVQFENSVMPNIDSYEDDADKLVFDMLVPTFGGASVNTEFEILTGSSLALWPSGYIPYTSYYGESNGAYAPNIIQEFNNNGYETMYLTPWGRDSYKSEYVYTLFGADKKIYGDNLSGERKGAYYSDDSLMDDIFEQLKDTSEGNYKFIMAASAENHYPFDADRFPITDVSATSTALTDEQLGMITSYAQGVYDADKALHKLYENIQTLDVPTIIVFYGDHLPHIVDSQGNKPYLASSYFNTDQAGLNEFRTYTTKAVILANYELDTTDELEYINASYLGAYVLNQMDLEVSDYFKFIDYTRSTLPVFDRNNAYVNGELVAINQLTDIQATAYENLDHARFRWFHDFLGA